MVNVFNLLDDFAAVVAKLRASLKPAGVFATLQWDADKLDPEALDGEHEDRTWLTMRTT
jgi:hypothetical protein